MISSYSYSILFFIIYPKKKATQNAKKDFFFNLPKLARSSLAPAPVAPKPEGYLPLLFFKNHNFLFILKNLFLVFS